MRPAEVQPPKTEATLSSLISFCAFSAKVGQSDAPSSTTGSICLPSTPPALLTSSMASNSESRTVTALIAMVPLRECRMATLMVLPLALPVSEGSLAQPETIETVDNRAREKTLIRLPDDSGTALHRRGWCPVT